MNALTIGEVAARSGVATSALRFYEEQGLIHSERTDAGHRRYPRAVIRRVAFIVFAQKIGLSLEEIRAELAKLPRNRVPERADWAKLSGELDEADPRAHRGARAPGGRTHRVHRLRLSVAGSLSAGEPGRSRGAARPGSSDVDESAPLVRSGRSPVACGFARAIIGDEASIPYTVLVKPTVAWEAQRMRCRRRKSISALTT